MTQNKKFTVMSFGVIMLCVLGIVSCSGSGDSSADSSSSEVTDNLQTVRDGLVPASLDYAQNSASISSAESLILHAREAGGDPCEAVDGDLFACQPVLLQLYMDMAKDFLDLVLDLVTETNSAIEAAADGESGSFEIEDDGIAVAYSKTSATDYSLLLTVDDESIGYVDVNSTQYTLQMDLTAIADVGDEAPESFEIVVNYTDDNTWNMVAFMTALPCDDDDARAPERFRLVIDKTDGLWAGKAMLYNGVWLYGMAEGEGNPTCDTEASDELAISFYTDFVGNDTATKASVYLMPRTLDTLDGIADYGMDNMDENFGASFDSSEYANPFCNEAGTLIATWDDDCSAVDATIGSAEFGSASDWVIPSEFYLDEITLPESL